MMLRLGMVAVGVLMVLVGDVAADPIGAVTLRDEFGAEVELGGEGGGIRIVVFGEPDHGPTLIACSRISDAIGREEIAGVGVGFVLVVTHEKALVEVRKAEEGSVLPELVLVDPRREAFGAYGVIVLPSVVVLDDGGEIVHSMPGFDPRLGEVVVAAVMLADGRMTREAFERVDNPPEVEAVDHARVRALRYVKLGERMREEGMLEAAGAQFELAIALAPELLRARNGLGWVRLEMGLVDEAGAEFEAVLLLEPDESEAGLGMGYVYISRGGESVMLAKEFGEKFVALHPKDARGHYLLGLVLELEGDVEAAMGEYKRAAGLLGAGVGD